ncbi:MAG: hypothetical protein JKY20_06385, partial [Alphaproteobacteria bacterium]|nr:hypothetical protein [Alphaproteobacteria bacterium]
MNFKVRTVSAILIAAGLATLGVTASVLQGERMKDAAHLEWLEQGKTDARRITDNVLFWISKAEVNLRAVAGQFHGIGDPSHEQFINLIDQARTWDPEVSFHEVAYARRFLRQDRKFYETSLAKPVTVIGEPQKQRRS